MTKVENKDRTVSRGLTAQAVVHMTKEDQVLVDGKWVCKERSEEDIDRDTFELKVGDDVVRWFNDVFGDGTFKRRITTNPDNGRTEVHIVNTCPNGMERTVEDYFVRSG